MNLSKSIFYSLTAAAGDSAVFSIILAFVFFIAGMFLLVRGADMFVDGAAKTALKLKVPMIIVGLTVVAFGTSAPEAAISVNAACRGEGAIAVGNIVGSNTLNILLILGICALMTAIPVKKNTFRIEIPFVVLSSAVFLVLGTDGSLSRIDGFILLGIFVLFIAYLAVTAVRNKKNDDPDESGSGVIVVTGRDTALKLVLMIVFGIAFVVVGSDITVTGAKVIAYSAGVDPRIIGLTAAALGTSLPELITGIAAARKKATDLAIGSIVGSNVFNLLFAGGLAASVSPYPVLFRPMLLIDSAAAIFAALLLWFLLLKNRSIGKRSGITMVSCYAVYLIWLIVQPMIIS